MVSIFDDLIFYDIIIAECLNILYARVLILRACDYQHAVCKVKIILIIHIMFLHLVEEILRQLYLPCETAGDILSLAEFLPLIICDAAGKILIHMKCRNPERYPGKRIAILLKIQECDISAETRTIGIDTLCAQVIFCMINNHLVILNELRQDHPVPRILAMTWPVEGDHPEMLILRNDPFCELLRRMIFFIAAEAIGRYHDICHVMRVLPAVIQTSDAVPLFIYVKLLFQNTNPFVLVLYFLYYDGI